ncbi:MAG: hypothetical protein J6B11_10675, partial [Spirochaetales bacterium]|nr:hypothetical protein [Spirochaetales bacterium]
TTPAELEVSGVMMPLSKSDFGDLVSEIRTQETSIKLNLAKVEGLKEIERKYLRDTCLTGQDQMKATLDYFGIRYD